jgi:hypothetical protein
MLCDVFTGGLWSTMGIAHGVGAQSRMDGAVCAAVVAVDSPCRKGRSKPKDSVRRSGSFDPDYPSGDLSDRRPDGSSGSSGIELHAAQGYCTFRRAPHAARGARARFHSWYGISLWCNSINILRPSPCPRGEGRGNALHRQPPSASRLNSQYISALLGRVISATSARQSAKATPTHIGRPFDQLILLLERGVQ